MYFQGSVFLFQFGKRYLAHLFSFTKILIDYNSTIIFEIIIHFFTGAISYYSQAERILTSFGEKYTMGR